MVSANTKDGRQTEENKRVPEEENNQYSQCWEGGGGKTAVGVSKDGISWRSETRDSVDTVYTYFLDRIRPIFKYVFDN